MVKYGARTELVSIGLFRSDSPESHRTLKSSFSNSIQDNEQLDPLSGLGRSDPVTFELSLNRELTWEGPRQEA